MADIYIYGDWRETEKARERECIKRNNCGKETLVCCIMCLCVYECVCEKRIIAYDNR